MRKWIIEIFKELGYWIEDKLKDLCGEITPDKRLTIILIMLLLFIILNIYFTFVTVKNWGREEERRKQLKIEHIRQLELEKKNKLELEFFDSEIDAPILDRIINNVNNNELYG